MRGAFNLCAADLFGELLSGSPLACAHSARERGVRGVRAKGVCKKLRHTRDPG
jgi:hypothetical protein